MAKTKSQPQEVVVVPVTPNITATSIEAELATRYNEEFIVLLRNLAYEISVVGLPIPEACVYVGVDHEKLIALMQSDSTIERLIRTKDVEYKRNLLVTVSEKAKTDDKISQWLLQARYPDEFNPRKGSRSPGSGEDDLIGVAMEFIQKSGDNSPLVTERSGKAFVIKRTSEENRETYKRIDSILK